MNWRRWTGVAAALAVLTGCAYGYQSTRVGVSYSASSRPHASYYCYDCHGYRYFDPYYDWCAGLGFRYSWSTHPRVITLYRERYVRIRQKHPEYGRYRYARDYRRQPEYREPRDYDAWRGRDGARDVRVKPKTKDGKGKDETPRIEKREKERERKDPGRKRDDERRERGKPRDDGSRRSPQRGVQT